MKDILKATSLNKFVLTRTINRLQQEGYIRISMVKNHKFFVLIRLGEYR